MHFEDTIDLKSADEDLEELSIGKNVTHLEYLPKYMNKLKIIEINSNYIKNLNGLPFSNSLESLIIEKTSIENLDYLPNYPKLIEIILNYNPFLRDLKNFPQSNQLRSIIICGNKRLTKLDGIPKKLENAFEININSNPIEEIPSFPSELPRLISLTVENCKFKQMDFTNIFMPKLRSISLKGNSIISLPLGIPKSIEKMDISYTDISQINVFDFPKLKFIDLKNLTNYVYQFIPPSLIAKFLITYRRDVCIGKLFTDRARFYLKKFFEFIDNTYENFLIRGELTDPFLSIENPSEFENYSDINNLYFRHIVPNILFDDAINRKKSKKKKEQSNNPKDIPNPKNIDRSEFNYKDENIISDEKNDEICFSNTNYNPSKLDISRIIQTDYWIKFYYYITTTFRREYDNIRKYETLSAKQKAYTSDYIIHETTMETFKLIKNLPNTTEFNEMKQEIINRLNRENVTESKKNDEIFL